VNGPLEGFRLERLEVLNWGTFHKAVWSFKPGGRDALLTGDIGSGKSTLVDAIGTLLLPTQKVAFNKAAGADKRERDLRSYVLGHHRSETVEATGLSRAVPLRGPGSYSVILGVFANAAVNSTVSLAKVFWYSTDPAGQPERFHVIADAGLSIAEHFREFGSDIAELRKRLRRIDGCEVLGSEYTKFLRTGVGAVPPDGLDEIGRQPRPVRARAHARTLRHGKDRRGHRRPLRGPRSGPQSRHPGRAADPTAGPAPGAVRPL
jgi:uncharacterized protein YPO0396